MNKFLVLIAVLAFIPATTAAVIQCPSNPPSTVASVDINRYSGLWYEIALIPYIFQLGCIKTTANYSLNANGTIRVENKCIRFGLKSKTIGLAVAQD